MKKETEKPKQTFLNYLHHKSGKKIKFKKGSIIRELHLGPPYKNFLAVVPNEEFPFIGRRAVPFLTEE